MPVLIWEISPSDEKNLDRYEGYPNFYYKKDLTLTVQMTGTDASQELTAMVYIMDERRQLASPTGYYYKVLADGYEDFRVCKAILEQALVDQRWKTYSQSIFERISGRLQGVANGEKEFEY